MVLRRLTWSLTPHSLAEEFLMKLRRLLQPCAASISYAPSPPHAACRHIVGRVLLLNRTMLNSQQLSYVDRFAYGWLRLSTTEPPKHRYHCIAVKTPDLFTGSLIFPKGKTGAKAPL